MTESINFMLKLIVFPFWKNTVTVTFASSLSKLKILIHPTSECCRLDFVIRKEYQFLKNVMTREEITSSNHPCSLEAYYEALIFIFKTYKFFIRQAEYPVTFDESTLNVEYKRRILLNHCSHTQTNSAI